MRDYNWDSLTNGKLLRDDVSPALNQQLRREFDAWVTTGNRKLFRSFKQLGVDDLHIDWRTTRARDVSL